MVPPSYQPILAKDIPSMPLSSSFQADGHVRVIAGSCKFSPCNWH